MPKTLLRQAQDVRKSESYVSNIAPSEANYQTDSTSLQYDLNAVRSALNNFLNRSGVGFPSTAWYADVSGTTFGSGTQPVADTGAPRGINATSQDLYDVEQKRVLFYATLLSDIVVPADQDYVVLGEGQIPTFNSGVAAVGNSRTTIGTVVAYNASFGAASLAEVTGETAMSPKNLCIVVDGTTRDAIQSDGRQIYALLQSESNTDGSTIGTATPNRVQLTFVRANAGGDDLELCPAADISGKTIQYAYVARQAFDALNEQNFLNGGFVDVASGAITTTLQQAYDNGDGTITTSGSKPLTFNLNSSGSEFVVNGFYQNPAVFYNLTGFSAECVGGPISLTTSKEGPNTGLNYMQLVASNENDDTNVELRSQVYGDGHKAELLLWSNSTNSDQTAKLLIEAGGANALGAIRIGNSLRDLGSSIGQDSNIDIGPGGDQTGYVHIDAGSTGLELNSTGEIKIGNDDIDQDIFIGSAGERTIQIGAPQNPNASPADPVFTGNNVKIGASDALKGGLVWVQPGTYGGVTVAGKQVDASDPENPLVGGSVGISSGKNVSVYVDLLCDDNGGTVFGNRLDGAILLSDNYSKWYQGYFDDNKVLGLAFSNAEYQAFYDNFDPVDSNYYGIISALNQAKSAADNVTLQQAYDNGKTIDIASGGTNPVVINGGTGDEFERTFYVKGDGSSVKGYVSLGADTMFGGPEDARLARIEGRSSSTIAFSARNSSTDANLDRTSVELKSFSQNQSAELNLVNFGKTDEGKQSLITIIAGSTSTSGAGSGQVAIQAGGGGTDLGLITIGYGGQFGDYDTNIDIGPSPVMAPRTGYVHIDAGTTGFELNSTGQIKIGNDPDNQKIFIGSAGVRDIFVGATTEPSPGSFTTTGLNVYADGLVTLGDSWGSGPQVNLQANGELVLFSKNAVSTPGSEAVGENITIRAAQTLKLTSLLGYEQTEYPQVGAIEFRDNYEAYAASLNGKSFYLSTASGEWNTFASNFNQTSPGYYSLISALNQAARRAPARVYATVQADVNAGNDTGGTGTAAANLSQPYPDDFVSLGILNSVLFLNGRLMQPGANAGAGNDYYPGTSFVAGDVEIKWNRDLLTDDVIVSLVY